MAKKRKKLECKICGRTTLSQNGMHYHLKSKHPDEPGSRKGVNWDFEGVAKTPLLPYCKKAPLSKTKPKKSPPRTATPNMQYIEVPAIIRIPISMGPIQIVSIGD